MGVWREYRRIMVREKERRVVEACGRAGHPMVPVGYVRMGNGWTARCECGLMVRLMTEEEVEAYLCR